MHGPESLCADFRGETLGREVSAILRSDAREISLSPLFVSPSPLLLNSHKNWPDLGAGREAPPTSQGKNKARLQESEKDISIA